MSDFKRWISYIFLYDMGGRRKNTGFVKIDARDGKCRLQVCVRGVYGSDGRKLDVGVYSWQMGEPQRFSIGKLYLRGGAGEYAAVTKTDDLFESGVSLEQSGGLWLTGPEKGAVYLASWEKEELDARDFFSEISEKVLYVSAASVSAALQMDVEAEKQPDDSAIEQKAQETAMGGGLPGQLQVIDVARLPEPDLWESLCRYYPKAGPELREKGIELLQIRPADIRYLPRRLWHYGSNSFLLHGYYHYRHLILGRVSRGGKKEYILGVRGKKEKRESFSAGLFGFERFLSLDGDTSEGYWYTPITLDMER